MTLTEIFLTLFFLSAGMKGTWGVLVWSHEEHQQQEEEEGEEEGDRTSGRLFQITNRLSVRLRGGSQHEVVQASRQQDRLPTEEEAKEEEEEKEGGDSSWRSYTFLPSRAPP